MFQTGRHRVEDAPGRLAGSVVAVPPADGSAAGAHSARVQAAGGHIPEVPSRRRGSSPGVPAPASDRFVGADAAGMREPAGHRVKSVSRRPKSNSLRSRPQQLRMPSVVIPPRLHAIDRHRAKRGCRRVSFADLVGAPASDAAGDSQRTRGPRTRRDGRVTAAGLIGASKASESPARQRGVAAHPATVHVACRHIEECATRRRRTFPVVPSPARHGAVRAHTAGVVAAGRHCGELAGGRARLSESVLAPASQRAVGQQTAGVRIAGRDGGVLTRRRIGLAGIVGTPTGHGGRRCGSRTSVSFRRRHG